MGLRDLSGLAGLMFLLFLLLGAHGFVASPASFVAPASPFAQTGGGTCPLNLDPENARLSVSVLLKSARVQATGERSHAAFAVSALTPCAWRASALLSDRAFMPADAPPPVLPGHDGPAAFALPPPFLA